MSRLSEKEQSILVRKGVDLCINECKNTYIYYNKFLSNDHKLTKLILKGLLKTMKKVKARTRKHDFKPPTNGIKLMVEFYPCTRCGLYREDYPHQF